LHKASGRYYVCDSVLDVKNMKAKRHKILLQQFPRALEGRKEQHGRARGRNPWDSSVGGAKL
jgi:hypothetical protein